MIERIRETVAESLRLKQSFFAANEENISVVVRAICEALEYGNKILLFGNGGSAADAQHIAAEWVGRYARERRPLAALALTTDTSILTCVGNDYGYEHVFDRQVRALGKPGDVAVAISTSGNSPNVCLATETANALGLVTVGLTGGNGGKLGTLVRHHLNVPHKAAARVQETHIMIGHILCQLVDETMKGL
jgi:D-sedoheptulose 7-phosphate isomerase